MQSCSGDDCIKSKIIARCDGCTKQTKTPAASRLRMSPLTQSSSYQSALEELLNENGGSEVTYGGKLPGRRQQRKNVQDDDQDDS